MPVWTRFVRFLADDGREYGGEPEDSSIDVGLAVLEGPVRVRVLSDPSPLREDATFTGQVQTIQRLLAPLPPSDIPSIRCVGLNYTGHAAELKMKTPEAPEIFLKPPTSVVGPADPILLPALAPHAVDGEVELAVVLGRACKDAPDADAALACVLGYTVANDVTCRDLQDQGSQWCFCKGFDSFCPLGPVLVAPSALAGASSSSSSSNTLALGLRSQLDGQVLQDGHTSNMIFSVGAILARLSQGTTLPAGTVVLTGTPEGIGHSYKPPRYLHSGATLRVSIGGIGTLTNPIQHA